MAAVFFDHRLHFFVDLRQRIMVIITTRDARLVCRNSNGVTRSVKFRDSIETAWDWNPIVRCADVITGVKIYDTISVEND